MRHFLSLADLSRAELWDLLKLTKTLKDTWYESGNSPLLKGKILGMVFQKPSLRTRASFDVAMLQLGGHAVYLSPHEIQLGQRESIPDVARVLSRYVDCIMARVFAHQDVIELARYSQVPVINGLSDYSHPCQALADFFTIYEVKGQFKGLNLAFVGDGNNVANSLLFGGALLGVNVTVVSPVGYEPQVGVVEKACALAAETGSRIAVVNDLANGVRGADVVYTDIWASMGQEAEKAERAKVFLSYQLNERLLSLVAADAIVMHCLPAHRGEEITDQVLEGSRSVVFDQAENRVHAQKALLVHLLAPDKVQAEEFCG
jgi:ornithine carbamoyltransferase